APLPVAPFVLAHWSAAKVGPDIHAKVGATLYSLPWRYLGEKVDARSTTSMVQFFLRGELIKTHPRKERGKQTDLGDYPPEKIAFHLRTPAWCRRRAAEIGPACEAVIGELLAEGALFGLRAAQGVLALGDKHDPGRLEAACAKATAAGDPSYRTIKGILAAGTEITATSRPAGDAGAPAHLHGPEQLFADLLADVIPLPTATGPHVAEAITTTPATDTTAPLTSGETAS
ncbi:MAG: IS21 family transposase, partial [Actinobacteria bacterium]|nr:IS21 family transposase [Actinomycetota bacterium]